MKINRVGKCSTDLEVFATSLLFNIDIWVYLRHFCTRWVGFSCKGLSLDELLKEPTPYGLYIQNVGNHYEPIISLKS